MRIAFETLGCKVNQYETEILKEQFTQAGYQVVPMGEEAEVFVLNSCTVTASGDKKTRQLLRRFRRQHPGARVVLTGCLPQANPTIGDALPEADVITGSYNRASLVEAVSRCLATGERVVQITPHRPGIAFEAMRAATMEGKTRAFLKIQDGCDRFCSYCIIPFARGPIRSKPLEELGEELSSLALSGYREVVLVGINLSLYGRDMGHRLTDGVALACATPGIQRVRLGSVEPELLTDGDILELSRHPKLCPQFHLALQSGCDATLRRMNRHYTTEEYRAVAERFRSLFPGAAITTDIMVGFPGETEEEFASTLAFVNSLGLAKAHIFSYSPRPGTPAATMPGQVPPAQKERRAALLAAAAEESRLAFHQSQVGRTVEVLIEAKTHPDWVEGYAPNYTPVRIKSPENLRGAICRVRIVTATAEGCQGVFAENETPRP